MPKHATVREDGNFVVLEHGGKRILMPKLVYEKRLQEVIQGATNVKYIYDKYHGSSAVMYDPEAPLPKAFNQRVTPSWANTSKEESGPVMTRENAFGAKKGGSKSKLMSMYE